MPVILALGSLRQEDYEFKAILGYIVRPCLKKKKIRLSPTYSHVVLGN
jgi:hypothetical protein